VVILWIYVTNGKCPLAFDGAKNFGSMDVWGFEPGVVGPKRPGEESIERETVVAVLTGCDSAHPCSFPDTLQKELERRYSSQRNQHINP
jgi:hypothetical protein